MMQNVAPPVSVEGSQALVSWALERELPAGSFSLVAEEV